MDASEQENMVETGWVLLGISLCSIKLEAPSNVCDLPAYPPARMMLSAL
jgi:hypothetical protein